MSHAASAASSNGRVRHSVDTVTADDGALIHDTDRGSGPPVVFSHGWPRSSVAWEDQMLWLASRGHRAIAHGWRGHGLPSQPWDGNDMDTAVDDLAALATRPTCRARCWSASRPAARWPAIRAGTATRARSAWRWSARWWR